MLSASKCSLKCSLIFIIEVELHTPHTGEGTALGLEVLPLLELLDCSKYILDT